MHPERAHGPRKCHLMAIAEASLLLVVVVREDASVLLSKFYVKNPLRLSSSSCAQPQTKKARLARAKRQQDEKFVSYINWNVCCVDTNRSFDTEKKTGAGVEWRRLMCASTGLAREFEELFWGIYRLRGVTFQPLTTRKVCEEIFRDRQPSPIPGRDKNEERMEEGRTAKNPE